MIDNQELGIDKYIKNLQINLLKVFYFYIFECRFMKDFFIQFFFGIIFIVLWDSRIVFENGIVILYCYKYYFFIMNLISQIELELESILEVCDGK